MFAAQIMSVNKKDNNAFLLFTAWKVLQAHFCLCIYLLPELPFAFWHTSVLQGKTINIFCSILIAACKVPVYLGETFIQMYHICIIFNI